jgi:hypothetical protein
MCHPVVMTRGTDTWWAHLVEVLATCGAVARDPHGLTVALGARGTPAVEIVMTEDEWDDLVSIMWGDVEPAAQHVRELVLRQRRGGRYLVYSQYDLVPSDRPELPANPVFARLRELAAQHPDGIPGAAWYAYDPDDTESGGRR